MNLKLKENNVIIGALLVFTIMALIALGPYFKIQQVVTYGLIPCLTIIAFTQDSKTFFYNNVEFSLLALILITSLISVFYYVDYNGLIANLSTLLGAVLAAYIPVALNKVKDYSLYFHIGYILSALALIIIMYISGNFSFAEFASKVDYRDRFLLNANAYSYFTFFANFSLFYLHEKYKTKLLTVLLMILPILFLIISFTTQSRSGLFSLIFINLCYWLIIKKNQNENKLKKLHRITFIFISIVALSFLFFNIYENSRIKNRISSSSNKVDAREVLIYDSFKVFTESPIIGVGLGQLPHYNGSGLFSHNSYIEILAEQGIIGGVILLLLFFIPLKKCLSLLMKNKQNAYLRINLLFFISFYLYNNAYPFYKFPFSMMFFFLIISIQNKNIIEP